MKLYSLLKAIWEKPLVIATLLLPMEVSSGKEYEASREVQKKIVNAAYITPSPGAGWCAMWVSQVYQNAGLGYIPECL